LPAPFSARTRAAGASRPVSARIPSSQSRPSRTRPRTSQNRLLNRDFRYQLTVLGEGAWARARVARKIQDHRFVVQTDRPGVEVSWQVTGIRHDPYARWRPVVVEETKPLEAQGRYLHPAAYGATPTTPAP
jgi:hypothetical protein